MHGQQPAPFALDESSPEPSEARCGINPLLRLDRARSRHTLAPGQRPGNTLAERKPAGLFNKGGQELGAASGEQ